MKKKRLIDVLTDNVISDNNHILCTTNERVVRIPLSIIKNEIKPGIRNLVLESDTSYNFDQAASGSSGHELMKDRAYILTDYLIPGEEYIVSALVSGQGSFTPYLSGATLLNIFSVSSDSPVWLSVVIKKSYHRSLVINLYTPSNIGFKGTIDKISIMKGNIPAIDWFPAWEDLR